MEFDIANSYSQNVNLVLQLTINSDFLTIKDFNNLSKVDKFLNYTCKKNINKYYDILNKCSQLPFEVLKKIIHGVI